MNEGYFQSFEIFKGGIDKNVNWSRHSHGKAMKTC